MQKMSFFSILFLSQLAFSMAIDWGGTYRFEYVELDRTSLGDQKNRKAYFLNHLNLSPKIIAADGVNIVSNFEVFPNLQYPNSQAGAPLGGGAGSIGNGADGANTSSTSQSSSQIEVNQLYLNVNQEYGSLLVGRAPLHFGTGMTHNAGTGLFDHWYDSRDLVGFKFLIGNLSLMPAFGKVYKSGYAHGGEMQDMIWNIEYNNLETESTFAIFHQTRSSVKETNDAWKTFGSTSADVIGRWNVRDVNVMIARGWEGFKFKLEAGFPDGSTGVKAVGTTETEIALSGYGIAMELDFPRPDSKWEWSLKTGIASGDDPRSADKFEGYAFDRNYDVAFLLFNHPLGQYNPFRSDFQRPRNRSVACGTSACPVYDKDQALDDDAISNTMYFSPRFIYRMNPKWDFGNSFTFAQLQTNPSATYTDVDKNVGYEWDISFTFKPHEKIRWVNELGLLFPGPAFREGGAGLENAFTYGVQSKASISF